MGNVSAIIKSIQDIMRKDVGVDGDAQRIGQLVWMFFLKIVDDREEEQELLDDEFKSALPENLRWCNWAKNDEGMTGDELQEFVDTKLFPTLADLPTAAGPQAVVIRRVFEDAYNYMKSGTLMRQVINKINEIDFNSTEDKHMFGDIYEQVLKDLQSAGNAGEFYTPRAVTQFMVDMVDPKLADKVLDPACGTGGFLACTIDHKRKKYEKSAEDRKTIDASIHGVEKKALPHLLATTNMILHGIDVPTNIRHDNTLKKSYADYKPSDRVEVILTNPPFGGMEEDGIESNFPAAFRTRETADLFLVLLITRLKKGGRAAVVLPDGTLFGEGIKTRIKEKLLKDCNLHTIVRLPKGVFNPYTGIKTNILFFDKGTPTTEVWYYEHPYPKGVKNYNKSKPMRIEEFEPEKAWWHNRVENDCAWKVPVQDIIDSGYDLDIDNPNVVHADHIAPSVLLAKFLENQEAMVKTQDTLKAILSEALSKDAGA